MGARRFMLLNKDAPSESVVVDAFTILHVSLTWGEYYLALQ